MPNVGWETCYECAGTGKICDNCADAVTECECGQTAPIECPDCHGRGKINMDAPIGERQ